jgi:hypothetical protein
LPFASGESLYLGAALLLAVVGISSRLRRRWLLRLRNLAAYLALAMIVMACPPFACIVDAIFLTAFGLWFLAVNQNTRRTKFADGGRPQRLS